MAVNRFSLYQMEQFKKERNKKLMESATKSVEECGFSSKQIKKMMKKKGKENEEEETKECGCGPMKKGKKLSKKEKAPGMRPEPKDKAVVHNMESDVIREARAKKSRKNGLQTKDVMRLKKEQKRMLKLRGNTKNKVAESDGNGILKATKLFKGVTKKGKGKKGMFDMKGSNKATKKNNKMHKATESDTPVKATKVVISESKKNAHDIHIQAVKLANRLDKKSLVRGDTIHQNKIAQDKLAAKKRNAYKARGLKSEDNQKTSKKRIGMPNVKAKQKNYKPENSQWS